MGTVKWFDEKKGFGFIRTENVESDIFVHYKHILGDGFKTLLKDELVLFEVVDTAKGLMATKVREIPHENR
jgi:CspA family cold shock protein